MKFIAVPKARWNYDMYKIKYGNMLWSGMDGRKKKEKNLRWPFWRSQKINRIKKNITVNTEILENEVIWLFVVVAESTVLNKMQ